MSLMVLFIGSGTFFPLIKEKLSALTRCGCPFTPDVKIHEDDRNVDLFFFIIRV